jgi:hypothetical protein
MPVQNEPVFAFAVLVTGSMEQVSPIQGTYLRWNVAVFFTLLVGSRDFCSSVPHVVSIKTLQTPFFMRLLLVFDMN